MYDADITNDHLNLTANFKKKCQVAVRKPQGYNEIEMQGTVLTPLKYSLQIDTTGKEMLAEE